MKNIENLPFPTFLKYECTENHNGNFRLPLSGENGGNDIPKSIFKQN